MKKAWIGVLCASIFPAWGQVGGYTGPGVISPGAGTIGEASGQPVSLRFYIDASAVYDNGIQPFAVNSSGQLVQLNGLYGEQLTGGVYGVHQWRQSVLGINYSGSYYNYQNATSFDGSSQNLSIGLTYQKSRRVVISLQGTGGTSALGYGTPGLYSGTTSAATTDIVNTPTSSLFDSRFYYAQAGASLTFYQTARTSYSMGGEGYYIQQNVSALASLRGYNLHGTIQHRLSRTRTVGGNYAHIHYDFPPAFGQSDLNSFQVFFADSLGKRWAYNIGAGAFQAEVQGLQQVALNPVIAALLGTSFGTQTFYSETWTPAGQATLTGKFHTSVLTFSAARSIAPGNGVFLTSTQNTGTANYSYTGIRKWNLGISGGYYQLSGIGQGLHGYASADAGGGFTYQLPHALHIIGRYDYRRQDLSFAGFRQNAYRVTFGIGFSPGSVPLSLW